MNELRRLIQQEPDKDVKMKLTIALCLYRELMTADNADLLDEYTTILLNVFKKKGNIAKDKFFSNRILEDFYHYLINMGKTESTAYDYARRIERICKEFDISVSNLFNRETGCSVEDLIGMYSPNGVKAEENKRKHNAPLSALKQFRDFMNSYLAEINDDDNDSFYLRDCEGYQSWEILSKHPCTIEITGRNCQITYRENRTNCGKVSKRINDDNYRELIGVFKKYKSILSSSTTPAFKTVPFGGVHSYSYKFEEKSNLSNFAFLFVSDNKALVEQAYQEYHEALEKIVNQ